MTPRRSYVLCATPRSGSTLLCRLLQSSGTAGQPESWFRRQNRAEWAANWGLAAPGGRVDWARYLAAAIAAGSSANGVFGLRLMWDTVAELMADLGSTGPSDHAGVLARTFGPVQYVLLTRRDLVAQAVSRHRAEVSGTWHLGFEEAVHPVEPAYDFARIAAWAAEAEAGNRAWEAWFAAQRIAPLVVEYEDLAAGPLTVAERTLSFLGLVTDRPLAVTNRRMADQISADWAERFRAEAG